MLFVFLVDTGTVYTFDMNIALETVANLKENVYRACKVAPEKQVLLISGGQSLDPSHRVCSYSAGTDTNPIFLFCKSSIESSVPPSPSFNFGSAQDLKEKVEACLADKETTYQTVAARAQLAQQLHETAREITRVCEQLVHDQHMQQQGWSAVVANLEDIVIAFKGRADLFEQTYHQYLSCREENIEILGHFSEDLAVLSDIPVMKSLLDRKDSEISLLDWIRSNDDENTNLNVVADHCTKALDQMDQHLLETLQKHIETALNSAERPEMKEIGGLGERLYGLEQLLVEARKKVQEQGELAQALHQNQQRARNLNDTSILPDLCASHRQQLKVMLRHDEKLRDIRNRCSRAKEELSTNLHARLRWVMFVQRQLADVDSRLVLQHENLRRLRRHFDLLRQLHVAPSIYLRSLIEVVRRRQFVSKFTQWANTLADHSVTVHQGEIAHRKVFSDSCEGHFLTLLFPSITDSFTVSFATCAPVPFDTSLPLVTYDDLERLKSALPSLWSTLKLPENLKDALREPMTLDWLYSSSQKLGIVEILVPQDNGVLPSLTAALLSPPIRPLRSRVKRSQSDFHSTDYFPDDSVSEHCHDESCQESKKQLEDELKAQRSQLLALRTHFQLALEAAQTALPSFRSELGNMRQLVAGSNTESAAFSLEWREKVAEQTQILLSSVENEWRTRVEVEKQEIAKVREENAKLSQDLDLVRRQTEEAGLKWDQEKKELLANAQRRLQQREEELVIERREQILLMVQKHQKQSGELEERIKLMEQNHQTALSEWKSAAEQETPESLKSWRQELLLSHEMELEQLKMEKETQMDDLQTEVDDSKSWQEKYQALLKDVEAQKLQIQQDLQHKHRLEMEGLRSRFRIMASATLGDRSPSDTSLEKVEMRSTPPSSPRNIVRPRSESHPEELLLGNSSELLFREKGKIQSIVTEYQHHCKQANIKPTKWEVALSDALQETHKTMSSITQQTDYSTKDLFSKNSLPFSTSISQTSPFNMAASVAVLQSTDDRSNQILTPSKPSTKKKPMSKITRSLIRQGSANVYGCEVGDAVLVQWDERYATHMLYNKGPYLHFLHADSITALNLQNVIEPFLARVLQREFCLVRKEENRYKLPKGTNFYRVKVEKLINST